MANSEMNNRYCVLEPPSAYSVLPAREDLHTEFKEAGSGLPENLCDTLCAFLNTDGGTLYLGVNDRGEALGLETEQIERYAKDIANLSNNPQKIDPPYLLFPREETLGDKRILVVQVPLSSQLHRHKGEIYLRSDEGDYRVKGAHQLAGLLNRKLGIFTEQTPMPLFSLKDLRPDLFERARTLMRRRNRNHPWLDLDMDALLRTAGLYTPADPPSRTLTLAAILLFGTDVAIRQAAPAYTFDCLLRRRDVERYDDRLMIDTNLIDAYDLMMGFIEKHLDDPFYLEHDASISLRERIFREAISNIISHREYRDATPARLMIYKDRVVLDNPAMAYFHTRITPRNLRSHPKNPAICKFMIQIARFDQLGSGVLNIHKYWPLYAPGAEPVFRETLHGFELLLPLPEAGTTAQDSEQVAEQVSEQVLSMLRVAATAPRTKRELLEAVGLTDAYLNYKRHLLPLLETGFIERTLSDKPNSRLQKYRLTEKGKEQVKVLESPQALVQANARVGEQVDEQVDEQVTRPESQPESRPGSRPESRPGSRLESKLAARVVTFLQAGSKGKAELARLLGHASVSGELKKQIMCLLEAGLIERSLPDKPNSRLQKYRLTEKGKLEVRDEK